MQSSPLFVTGLGPGSAELLSPQAFATLESCRVIAGYTKYIELVPPALLKGKKIIQSGMMSEIARCNAAIDAALGVSFDYCGSGPASVPDPAAPPLPRPDPKCGLKPEPTCLVCSGDPGIYALAGLVYELAEQRGLGPEVLDIRVIPGIPAVCAAAALLGAPLMHDFAVISLSDLLTPWELIERRINHALAGDFVMAVYNPRSKKRNWQLDALLKAALEERGPEGIVGLVRNAYRDDQHVSIHRLGAFDPAQADMLSILLIGNSQCRVRPDSAGGEDWARGARMVTPRGYLSKYGVEGSR